MTHRTDHPRSIILDCDPGHDDAVAIMLALGSPAIELLGVTTVGGNQTVDKITRNAQSVLEVCRRQDVPVHRGSARPLLREVHVAGDIHGESGLDGVELPEPTVPVAAQRAVEFIVQTVMESEPGEITLVCTGPLTNLALAVRLEPAIIDRVREVVIMGGGYHEGNVTPVAEFNIWADPEAAAIVVDAGWELTMVGLDLTHQALATADVEQRIAEIGTDLAAFFLGLMAFFRRAYQENQGFDDPPVHDACTIAYLIDPAVVQTRRAPLHVETRGDLTRGMTVADLRPGADLAGCRTQVATALDADGFWRLVVDAVRSLG
ncbi:nucleoside hydrolase [Brachybacterium halotolerans subsp. kimchii]|uniref:uridine-preferring nucleoside hydrolase UriH n=1 Tax=Brachybacterium halotolerans TaxID=2795215 RepID=UPI001E295459|nr:nucleoside hydrolase [Brachybacterium halotolerans]UEJ81800.1 nucleoside hydrolase [Brachybacterium halotolerans subsp. kimchii]